MSVDPLEFLSRDLATVATWIEPRRALPDVEWHLTHVLFFPSLEARDRFVEQMKPHGAWVSYVDTFVEADASGAEVTQQWIDLIEPMQLEFDELRSKLLRVVNTAHRYKGQFNHFFIVGSNGENWQS